MRGSWISGAVDRTSHWLGATLRRPAHAVCFGRPTGFSATAKVSGPELSYIIARRAKRGVAYTWLQRGVHEARCMWCDPNVRGTECRWARILLRGSISCARPKTSRQCGHHRTVGTPRGAGDGAAGNGPVLTAINLRTWHTCHNAVTRGSSIRDLLCARQCEFRARCDCACSAVMVRLA